MPDYSVHLDPLTHSKGNWKCLNFYKISKSISVLFNAQNQFKNIVAFICALHFTILATATAVATVKAQQQQLQQEAATATAVATAAAEQKQLELSRRMKQKYAWKKSIQSHVLEKITFH